MRRLSVLTIACVAAALGGCSAVYPTYVMSPAPAPMGAYGSAGSAPNNAVRNNTARNNAAPNNAAPNNAVAVQEAELSSADQPRPRAVSRAAAARPDGSQTTGEASPSQYPRYSPEWWKEQDRVDDSMKRALDICRGC